MGFRDEIKDVSKNAADLRKSIIKSGIPTDTSYYIDEDVVDDCMDFIEGSYRSKIQKLRFSGVGSNKYSYKLQIYLQIAVDSNVTKEEVLKKAVTRTSGEVPEAISLVLTFRNIGDVEKIVKLLIKRIVKGMKFNYISINGSYTKGDGCVPLDLLPKRIMKDLKEKRKDEIKILGNYVDKISVNYQILTGINCNKDGVIK